MNPLVYKDTDFQNKVQMGYHWGTETQCYVDLEKIKEDCLSFCSFWKDGYNKERETVGLPSLNEEEMKNYILSCFNQPGYAVPFTWYGGLVVFLYREGNQIFFASQPIIETTFEKSVEKVDWWKSFFKLFENKS